MIMFGADLEAFDEVEVSSTPNKAPVINPEPCGRGGGAVSFSFGARVGLGDGAFEEGPVGVVPLSFFPDFAIFAGTVFSVSMSMATGCCKRDVDPDFSC
jgi:hypothetical protein